MPAISASAPGKIILFGEHAVVYGQPALAVPVNQVKAKAIVTANPKGVPGTVRVLAPNIELDGLLNDLGKDQPLAAAIHRAAKALGVKGIPACTVKVTSTIPIASGLGSGAAVSVALLRAMSSFLGCPLSDDQICSLAYDIEKIHHGTPSGIDNTVITYARPVYFVKGEPVETMHVARAFTIVIGNTGIVSPTKESVGDVRSAWKAHKSIYEAYFESAGAMAQSARQAIESGGIELLGPLMDANHGLLRKIGVSCPELDALVLTARRAGALGAKLSGGGRGGNMIALVNADRAKAVAAALEQAGATQTIVTRIGAE